MDKRTFLQHFIITRTNETPEAALEKALEAYQLIEDNFTKAKKNSQAKKPSSDQDYYITANGHHLKGEELTWFNSIWKAWNSPSEGKKAAADAFLKQNPTKDIARQMYVAAKQYAANRQDIVARGGTPKYFQGWCNEGRWDTALSDGADLQPDTEVHINSNKELDRIKADIIEQKAAIKQFKGLGQDQLIPAAEQRLEELQAQLMQITREN